MGDKTASYLAYNCKGYWCDVKDFMKGKKFGLVKFKAMKIEIFDKEINKKEPHLILMVGPPGSGKTLFCEQNIPKNYIILNLDTIKSNSKMNKMFKEALIKKKNIVLDNTNRTKEKRL